MPRTLPCAMTPCRPLSHFCNSDRTRAGEPQAVVRRLGTGTFPDYLTAARCLMLLYPLAPPFPSQFTSREFRSQEANMVQMIHTGQVKDPELGVPPETHGERQASALSVLGPEHYRYNMMLSARFQHVLECIFYCRIYISTCEFFIVSFIN